jgi:hypothetical protein
MLISHLWLWRGNVCEPLETIQPELRRSPTIKELIDYDPFCGSQRKLFDHG